MSISSSTDIGNMALDLLSAGNVTDIENPTSPTEELLNRWYNHTRKKLLREHPWNFAIKRTNLAASSTVPAFGYDKQFPLPSDFLRLLTINDSTYTQDVPSSSRQFRVENGNILVSNIYSDSNTLKLKYVSDFTNVSQMDALFVEIVVYELALAIAYKVAESNTNIERIGALLRDKKSLAKGVDGQEDPPRIIERSRSRHVRRNNHSNVDSHRIKF